MSSIRLSSCRVAPPKASGSASCIVPRARIVSRQRTVHVRALQGGPPKPSEEKKPQKALTRANEPEQFWKSKGEADGANVFKDPMAIVGVVGILFPFVLLAILGSSGIVDFSVYRGQ